MSPLNAISKSVKFSVLVVRTPYVIVIRHSRNNLNYSCIGQVNLQIKGKKLRNNVNDLDKNHANQFFSSKFKKKN